MNRQQFELVASLLQIVDPIRSAAREVVIDNRDQAETIEAYGCPPDKTNAAIDGIRNTELSIRGVFVNHGATEWEVVVGHNDHHRRPGQITLQTNQIVWLVCRRTYLKVPVRVTELSGSTTGYHRGIIDEHVESTRYSAGDCVSFGEEQAEIPSVPARSRRARKLMPFA